METRQAEAIEAENDLLEKAKGAHKAAQEGFYKETARLRELTFFYSRMKLLEKEISATESQLKKLNTSISVKENKKLFPEEKLEVTCEWMDDALTMLTDVLRLPLAFLDTCSTTFSGLSSTWNLVRSYRKDKIKNRRLKIALDLFGLFVFVAINFLTAAHNVFLYAFSISLNLFSFGVALISISKNYYFFKDTEKELFEKEKQLVSYYEPIMQGNDRDASHYRQYFYKRIPPCHQQLKELQESYFQSKRAVTFGDINLIAKSCSLMSAIALLAVPTLPFAAISAAIMIASTAFEIIDRRLNCFLTRRIKAFFTSTENIDCTPLSGKNNNAFILSCFHTKPTIKKAQMLKAIVFDDFTGSRLRKKRERPSNRLEISEDTKKTCRC